MKKDGILAGHKGTEVDFYEVVRVTSLSVVVQTRKQARFSRILFSSALRYL